MSETVKKLMKMADDFAIAVASFPVNPSMQERELTMDLLRKMRTTLEREVKRADDEAARLRTELAEGKRLTARWAKWIVLRDRGLPDHACAECAPTSDMVVAGFRCVFHEAKQWSAKP